MAGKGAHTADYIKSLIPLGFESFQINFWESLEGVELPRLADELRPVLHESGCVISSFAVFGNPLESDEGARETVRTWEQCIEHASLFGTDIVAGFAGRLRGRPIPDSLPRFRDVFGKLSDEAGQRDVRIAFENCSMGGNWQAGDWNIAHCPEAWELMFDALPADHVGLEWEPCHQLLLLIDPLAQLRAWHQKIFHVHGKDASVHWDTIRREGIASATPYAFHRNPGVGDTNWTDVISELRRLGFEGSIDIEGWHDPVYRGEYEMTGQLHALRYLKECRGGSFVPNPPFCLGGK